MNNSHWEIIRKLNTDFEQILKKIIGKKLLKIQIHESGYSITFDDDLILNFGGDFYVVLYENGKKVGDDSLLAIPPIDDIILIE